MLNWLKAIFSKKPAKATPEKVLLVISDAGIIDHLKKRGDHKSSADLINWALTTYGWALDALDEGRIIGSINVRDDSYHELSIPAFDRLKKQIPWGTWVNHNKDVCECEGQEDQDAWQ